MTRRLAAALALPALLSLSASVARAAWPHDPTLNVPVSVGSGTRQNQVAVADGSGGVFIAWEDKRSGIWRIYAQHVLGDGTIAPGWTTNGIEVKTTYASRALNLPAICDDGAGGAVIVWRETFSASDRNIYAQRMSPDGVRLWGATGVGVASSSYDQDQPRAVSDGAGSTLIVWQEDHAGEGTGMDVYANRVGPNGVIRWGAAGTSLCSALGDQVSPALVSDGSGGLDAGWIDGRGPNSGAIYVTRRDSSGTLHAGWTVMGQAIVTGNYYYSQPLLVGNSSGGMLVVWSDDRNGGDTWDVFAAALIGNGFPIGFVGGSAVCTANDKQTGLRAVSDGADGAFVAWSDLRTGTTQDVYAEHLGSTGEIASGWPDASVALPVLTGIDLQALSDLAPDGVGGVILATYAGYARYDVFATHLTSSGARAEGWSMSMPVCTAIDDQFHPICVSDGASGAILAWQDRRNGYPWELYAQRIDKWGQLGNAEPAIVAVKDVPNDQGGSVRVSWSASYLDAYPDYTVGSYWLWRQVPASAALAALRSGGARLLAAGADARVVTSGDRWLRAVPAADATVYWEFVASQAAAGFPGYSLVAATTSDSTPSSNPLTLFMVEARGGGHLAWDSAPLGGYSMDNLAPPAPQPFAASYSAGVTSLHWGPASAPDLAGYRLYRGSSAGFTPSPANRIGTPTDTTFADNPGGFYYYKVSAVDVHGNEGPTSLAFPTATTDVAAGTPRALALGEIAPNPARTGAIVHWALLRAASVRLTVLDLAGRRVRTLLDGDQPAGQHAVRWDARDESGRAVASGVYFVSLEAEGHAIRARMAVIR